MIDHAAVLLACRTQLDTLSVATTGSVSIAATTTGYTRSSGSFITDGFQVGQELIGTGFSEPANNSRKTITAVAAGVLTAAGTTTESAGTRTLTVGVPNGVASENIPFTPAQGEPYFREEYVPGPMSQHTIGPTGELEGFPLYILRVHVPINVGVLGVWGYVEALQTLFSPGTALTVTGHTVIVRRDTSPFASQLLKLDSYAAVTVTIPLRVWTLND